MKRCFGIGCILCSLLILLGWSQGLASVTTLPGANPAELHGVWQDSDMVGSGYTRLFLFYPDGRYLFLENQMDDVTREREHSGKWRLDHKTLILTVLQRVTLVGGKVEQGGEEAFLVTDEHLIDAEAELQQVEPAEEIRLAVEEANMDPDDGYCSMRLEGALYYQLTDEEGLAYFEDWFSFTPYTFAMDPSFLAVGPVGQGFLSLRVSPEEYAGLDWSGRAFMLPDGGALLQDTLWGNPYALRMNAEGGVLWQVFLEDCFEGEASSGLLRDAVRMPDGCFAFLFQYYGVEEAEQPDCIIAYVTETGQPDRIQPLPAVAKSLVSGDAGLYTVGEESILGDEGHSAAIRVTRLTWDGATEWEKQFKLDGFNTVDVTKALWADDGLILSATGEITSTDERIPLLYKLDNPDGLRTIWRGESAGSGAHTFISDVATMPDGGVVALLNQFIYSGEWDLVERKGSVYCWDGTGRLLWTETADRDGTLDSVIQVPMGYLCASRGMDQENCPNLGEGWMLLLGPDGENLLNRGIVDLSPEGVEVWGLTTDAQGQAILYGCELLEPGFPGPPFIAKIDLSGTLSPPAEDSD